MSKYQIPTHFTVTPLADHAATLDGIPGTLDNEALIAFLFAGQAIFTLVSETGERFTYQFQKRSYKLKGTDREGSCFWVNLLTGPNNLSDYTYLGSLSTDKTRGFNLSEKSRVKSAQLPSVAAVSWLLARIELFEQGVKATVMPPKMKFYHAGVCGRCGRTLTVPSSVESGFGPDCVGLVAKGAPKRIKQHVIG